MVNSVSSTRWLPNPHYFTENQRLVMAKSGSFGGSQPAIRYFANPQLRACWVACSSTAVFGGALRTTSPNDMCRSGRVVRFWSQFYFLTPPEKTAGPLCSSGGFYFRYKLGCQFAQLFAGRVGFNRNSCCMLLA